MEMKVEPRAAGAAQTVKSVTILGSTGSVGCNTLDLIVALSYGGRAEIANAARRVAEDVAAGKIAVEDIDEESVAAYLETVGIPDPDIMVRTSGEQRISNFLLWQMAYTEFVFLDTLWPDFSEKDFVQVISEFQRRERRFGGT